MWARGLNTSARALPWWRHNKQGLSRKGGQENPGKTSIAAFLEGTNANLFCFLL
jgi:hypothetical protein